MENRRFILAAGLVLAMALTFSCSSDDDGGGPDEKNEPSSSSVGGGNPSSSSVGGGTPSSSEAEQESSSSGGGFNLPDLPKNVYLYDENLERIEYEGDGDIMIVTSNYHTCACALVCYDKYGRLCDGEICDYDNCICDDNKNNCNSDGILINGYKTGGMCDCTGYDGVFYPSVKEEYTHDTLSAGEIQNGQIALDLPASINSKYMTSFSEIFDGYCSLDYPSGFSIFAYGFDVSTTLDKSCKIDLYAVDTGMRIDFPYFSQSGSITGSCDDGMEWDARNFSEGWNFVMINQEGRATTTIPANTTLEWRLVCQEEE